MKKILIIGLIILIILLFALLLIGKSQKPKTAPYPAPTMTLPTITPFLTPSGDKIEINKIPVNNFYKTPVKENPQNDVLIVNADNYQIVYLQQFNKFLITILNSNFEQTRTIAEKDFLNKLGISESDACKLTVEESTPEDINSKIAGQIFPLSFCK